MSRKKIICRNKNIISIDEINKILEDCILFTSQNYDWKIYILAQS